MTVEVVTRTDNFESLEAEWIGLYRSSGHATPFQSWGWLFSWWENFGGGMDLRLVLLRDGGVLVAIFPLMLERRPGVTRLTFVGSGISDYLDIIVRDGYERKVLGAAASILREVPGDWGIADFSQMRSTAHAWCLFRDWPGPALHMRQSVCPVMDASGWDEIMSRLSRNRRSTFRRSIRRFDEDGAVRKLAPEPAAKDAAKRFVGLHKTMWEGRGVTPLHLTTEFESHMVSASHRMTREGTGAISEFWLDGEVIASQFLTFGKDSVGSLLTGSTKEAWKEYQVSSLFVWDAVEIALEKGLPLVDLLRGDEDYKLKWNTGMVELGRATLCRKKLQWAVFLGYQGINAGRKSAYRKVSESLPKRFRPKG